MTPETVAANAVVNYLNSLPFGDRTMLITKEIADGIIEALATAGVPDEARQPYLGTIQRAAQMYAEGELAFVPLVYDVRRIAVGVLEAANVGSRA